MPTKTDRILSNLPSTYQIQPRGRTLESVVDPFGRELQAAENSLAAVMQAHWVDVADLGAAEIDDLARIAALYGLAPQTDETVEAFREHLKRYVRTFLEGTVTVQGILRITAEALGLHIANDYADIDTWWTRTDDAITRSSLDGRDGAQRLLGVRAAHDRGQSAQAAHVRGTVDLTPGVDCRTNRVLRLKVDGEGPFEIDLTDGAANPTAVTGAEIVTAVNSAFGGKEIARFDGQFLTLSSPERGPLSELDVQDVANDAADAVLGLPPRTYHGRDAQPATVRGTVDLSGVLDLSEARYLRLLIDGEHLAEIDCAGPDEAHTLLDQVVEAVNGALGMDALAHDGQFLTLTSPTDGLGSSLVFERAAAQQALARLFGPVSATHIGRGPLPARVVGRRDLSAGVDLSAAGSIRLRVDGVSSVIIDCRGENPTDTQLPELVTAINEGVGAQIASHDGRGLILTSTTTGSASEILFQTPDEGDATEILFGIGPRLFHGRAATQARVIGTPDLSNGVDLTTQYRLLLAVDGRAPVPVDLRTHADDVRAVMLPELADAVDAAFGADVAAHDGQHLILVSPTAGSGSSLSVESITLERRERFVSRAIITDEATGTLFGFHQRTAHGRDATNARVVGQVDLQRGVDLREHRYLRLVVDNHAPVEIDCAGPRPRATLLEEARDRINAALKAALLIDYDVASDNGRRLILSSQKTGQHSRIAFEPSRSRDALETLLGVGPGEWHGRDAEQVRFVGTADLSQGVDLSGGDRIRLALDGGEPVDVACAANAADPARVTLNEITIAINLAFGRNVVSHSGTFLQITSPTIGAGSQLVFEQPDADDATRALFGIDAPRSYHGADAEPARVVGSRDGIIGFDLREARFLRVGVDGRPPIDVDCRLDGVGLATAVTLDEVVAAINDALDAKVASHDDTVLTLTSPTVGQAGRIVIEPHASGDARVALFGDVALVSEGADPQPASITGAADLLQPVDVSQRSRIRLAVDGALPVDIDVAGVKPRATFLDELVGAINAVFPGLAAATADSRLRLTAPSTGADSRLDVLPLRTLDVVEYPPTFAELLTRDVRHGTRWQADNRGAAAGMVEVGLTAVHGTTGPTLLNETTGWQLRLLVALGAGESLRVWADGERLRAAIRSTAGRVRAVGAAAMLVGPLGGQAHVPFAGEWMLSGDEAAPPSLQLNNPHADRIVWLHGRGVVTAAGTIGVTVAEGTLDEVALDPVALDGQTVVVHGRVQSSDDEMRLVDAAGESVAVLRDGRGVRVAPFVGRVAAVTGTIHPGDDDEPLLIVQELVALFNVTLRSVPEAGEAVEERYEMVTIGRGGGDWRALTRQIQTRPSQLVRAESLPKTTVLSLPQGRSTWRYTDCYGPRFDHAHFDEAIFPGGICLDRGVFDVSRFVNAPPEGVAAVFTGDDPINDPPAALTFAATQYQPGAFRVHLPADLPVRFGAQFNEARFGQGRDNPELYERAVTEPEGDDAHIETLLNTRSSLVEADVVPRVPLGWEPQAVPFREPRTLTGGDSSTAAQIYLSEEGIDGFLRIVAREQGAWGNRIGIAARASGPAMLDVSVMYEGDPLENGRDTVAGKPLARLTAESLKPGPVGVLQAKAAGVRVDVTRERIPVVGGEAPATGLH